MRPSPCPFLQDSACAIYDERPLVCREYLVTNPPAACTTLTPGEIHYVEIPGSTFHALNACNH